MIRFVINLDRSKDRWNDISRILKDKDISVDRVSGVDGTRLTQQELQATVEPLNSWRKEGFPKELTPGEVGCFLSHRNCWQRFLQTDEKWALILEDDLVLSDRAPQYMKSEDWIPPEVNIIQLHSLVPEKIFSIGAGVIHLGEGADLVQPIRPIPLGTQCYLISRNAAEYALRKSKKIPAPVDEFLFSPLFEFAKSFPIWRIDPCIVIPSKSESEIGSKMRTSISPLWIRFGLRRTLGKANNQIRHWVCKKRLLSFK